MPKTPRTYTRFVLVDLSHDNNPGQVLARVNRSRLIKIDVSYDKDYKKAVAYMGFDPNHCLRQISPVNGEKFVLGAGQPLFAQIDLDYLAEATIYVTVEDSITEGILTDTGDTVEGGEKETLADSPVPGPRRTAKDR